MSTGIGKRLPRSGGFSLVEAVVAVMVLAVVAAMAFPYFNGEGSRDGGNGPAETPDWMQPSPPADDTDSTMPDWMAADPYSGDRDAQVEIRDVLLAEKAYWLEHGDYTDSATDIAALDQGARISTSPASGVVIALSEASADTVCITRRSASGRTFSVWESATAGTYYGASDLSARACPAAVPAGYAPGGW